MHRKALDRIAIGPVTAEKENHALPVLDVIEYEDMVFYVFPLMHQGFAYPWYFSFNEVVDACEQLLEVSPWTPCCSKRWLRSMAGL